ncbi:MAG TPA: cation:proton antiporter [Rhodothermales bacterium]|nr:cation:proton antiporter [Rhodothermales bacterium]
MNLDTVIPPILAGLMLPFLGEVVAILAAGVVLAYICNRIRLVPIVGFLLAGIAIGPSALGLVSDGELINGLAEVGVILLLFTIGVEFSLEKLGRIRHLILFGGGLQVVLTVGIVTGALLAAGVSIEAAIFTGCLVALSSTAIVLTLLSDRSETETPTGRLSLAILIFQDLAIIVMVLLVTAFGREGASPVQIILALGQALALIALVLVAARKIVPWLLERIAATRKLELFLPTVVTICLGTAWITSLAGVSLALGAFVAGLVVSESRYSEHALSEILPLKTLFNAAFFVSVGMLLDLRFVLDNVWLVLGVAVAVLAIKLLVTTVSVLALRFPMRVALTVGLGLSQIGEFSFVLERTGQAVELFPADLGGLGTQIFIAVTVLLMALTPLLLYLGPKLGTSLAQIPGPWSHTDVPEEGPPKPQFEDHVVIAGYGPAGRRLVMVMKDIGLPFTIVEMDFKLCAEAESKNLPVVQGDATRPLILEHAGIHTAKLCVVVVSDEAATVGIVQIVRYLNPTVQIIARTRFLSQIPILQEAGADVVVPEELETSVRIFTQVLNAYMVPAEEINRQVSLVRSGDYEVFRGSIQEAHLMVLQGLDEEGLHTRAVAVRDGTAVADRTLRELGLRQTHNLTVLAVRRGTRTIGNPAGDFRLEPGDRLILVGSAADFVASADLFRTPESDSGRAPVQQVSESTPQEDA